MKNNFLTNHKIQHIRDLYELEESKLIDAYNDAFIKMFKKAYDESKFYRNLYTEYGIRKNDIKNINDIHRLPVIKKSSIIDNANNIYIGLNILKVKGLTSGTSGSPALVYRTPDSINTENAYLRYYREEFGFTCKHKILSIRGLLGKNKLYHHNNLSNNLSISGPNINKETIHIIFQLIKDFNPVAIEAFPSYLFKFYTELKENGLCIEVKNIFTSSEMLYSFQREKIETFFKSRIHDWYGNVERTICLAQDKYNKYYPLPLYSINEFQNNSIITTSLINHSFPLIRYEVDDRISVKSDSFFENLVHPEIIRIEGRSGDTLELKDGSIVGCIDHAFKGIDNLIMAQVYQSVADKSIEFKLVVNNGFNEINQSKLYQNIKRMIGTETPIRLTFCNENDLIYHKNKKYQLIIKND